MKIKNLSEHIAIHKVLNVDERIRKAMFAGGGGGGVATITETDPIVGAVNGIIMSDGAGTIVPAVAGTDYLDPTYIDDTAYGAGWDGVTNIAPSQNAVYDAISALGGGHNAVTLSADADAFLSLTGQDLGLDTINANLVFASPISGAAAVPAFRSLVATDIPDLSSVYSIVAHTQTFSTITATPTTLAGYGITDSLVLGETSTTAYRGDRGKTAYDHTSLTNNPHSVTAAQASAVALTGAESIDGVKTFTSFPVTPSASPTTNYQVANKAYVDAIASGLTWKEPVLDKDLSDPPGSPTSGDRYIVKATGINAWSGHDNDIAEWNGASWDFTDAVTGWAIITTDDNKGWTWDGASWIQFTASEAYTASLGVEKVGNDFRADLLATGALGLTANELKVNVDGSSIEISTNALQVKALGITNAMLAGSIADSKLSQITTASKVSGAAITLLTSVPSGAGLIPVANLGTGGSATDFLRKDQTWATPTGGGGSSSSTIVTDFDILSYARTTSTESTSLWTNMPAATTELFGSTFTRFRLDITNASQYRIWVHQQVAGYAGADFNLQYSVDNGVNWLACDTAGAGELDVGTGTGYKYGTFADLVSGAKGDYLFRIVGKQGNGVADPSWRQIHIQFKIPGGDALTFQYSVTKSGTTVNLVNDSASPGNTKYYGTNASGTKGFFDLPSSSGAVWGSITGTLANQTDLQDALDLKSNTSHNHNLADLTEHSYNSLTDKPTIPSQYTDEMAQDAVGNILTDTPTIDFTYSDLGNTIQADVINSSITYAKIQNVSASDKLLGRVSASAGVIEEITFTDFAQSILDDANEATFKATVNLEIGTDVQAYDATLTSIALLGTAADKGLYSTNVDTWAEFSLTAAGRALLDDANAAAQIATLGLDADLATFSLPASTTISAFGATIVDDANAAAVIATLGLDADIATFSLPASTTITAAAATILDDTTVGAIRTTLGVGTADSPTFAGLTIPDTSINTTPFGRAGTVIFKSAGTDNDYSEIDFQANNGVIAAGIAVQITNEAARYGKFIFGARGAAGWNGAVLTMDNLTSTFTTALARGANAITGSGDLGATGTYIGTAYITRHYLNSTAYLDGTNAGRIGIVGTVDAFTTTANNGITIGSGDSADNDVLLKFNTDRGWQFEVDNVDASTKLVLRALVDGKAFVIQSTDSTNSAVFNTSNTDDSNSLSLTGPIYALSVGTSSSYIANSYLSRVYLNSTAYLDGATAGVMDLYVGGAFLRITRAAAGKVQLAGGGS